MKPGWRRLLQVDPFLFFWSENHERQVEMPCTGPEVGLAASHLPNISTQRQDRTSGPVMAGQAGAAPKACT